MKKLLILSLLLISCGGGYRISGRAEIVHKLTIDLDSISNFCEDAYNTQDDIDKCKDDLINVITSLLDKEQFQE